MNIPEKLDCFINEEAERSGCHVVKASIKGVKSVHLEVLLDAEGGVTLDQCGALNRKINAYMESENMFDGQYSLDVCSPGLDMELVDPGDFRWAVGKDVKVKVHEPVNGQSVINGRLAAVDANGTLSVEPEDNETVRVDRSNIAKACLSAKIK
jgi:ribosome maturation factor RimP